MAKKNKDLYDRAAFREIEINGKKCIVAGELVSQEEMQEAFDRGKDLSDRAALMDAHGKEIDSMRELLSQCYSDKNKQSGVIDSKNERIVLLQRKCSFYSIVCVVLAGYFALRMIFNMSCW